MLFSIGIILLLGLGIGSVFSKLKLPPLIGMISLGLVLGPSVFDLIDSSLLNISSELRKIALIIILMRAGLALDVGKLKKIGRSALLMSFLPATLEIIGCGILAPLILNISLIDGLLLGSVIAAVSPAVIVPRMVELMEKGYGTRKNIPQLIMASASVDDIFVIVLFSVFSSISLGKGDGIFSIINIPISIASGGFLGLVIGVAFVYLFKKYHYRDSVKVILILAVAFLLVSLEEGLKDIISISSLLGVMVIGLVIAEKYQALAERLSMKFSKLWIGAEVFLFVLVGATVDIKLLATAGLGALALVLLLLGFRSVGVYLSLLGTHLNKKEKLYCTLAFLPKATVQAAIGGVPLAMGITSGNLILTIAVLSIVVCAPLGAILMDRSYKRLLDK